jgi:hypothetical protein
MLDKSNALEEIHKLHIEKLKTYISKKMPEELKSDKDFMLAAVKKEKEP